MDSVVAVERGARAEKSRERKDLRCSMKLNRQYIIYSSKLTTQCFYHWEH